MEENQQNESVSQGGDASAETSQSGAELGEFKSLDPDVIFVWRLNQFIGSAILLLLALMGGLILWFNFPWLGNWLVLGWVGLAVFRAWLWFWYPPRAYRAWGYRMDDKVLEIKRGVVFRVWQLLPLSRLQHVDLHRGPVERYVGLASLVLHTAGTHESTLVIPGLEAEEATRLRDHLVAVGGDDGV